MIFGIQILLVEISMLFMKKSCQLILKKFGLKKLKKNKAAKWNYFTQTRRITESFACVWLVELKITKVYYNCIL